MMTNMELRQRQTDWVDALREPNRQQGTSVLRRGDKYCCLGVACGTAIPGLWKRTSPNREMAFEFHAFDSDKLEVEYTSLSSDAREYLGLSYKQQDYLIAMNDGHVMTSEDKDIRCTTKRRDFKFIARFIELMFGLNLEQTNV